MSDYFVRKSSGLIRQFTWREAFLISQGVQAASFWAVGSQVAWVIGADPGADLVISTFLGFLFSLPLGLTYYLLSTAMPRSGGDYVWISRLANPVLGFVAGWAYWIAVSALLGSVSAIVAGAIVGNAAISLGYWFNNPGLITLATTLTSSNMNIFAVGLVMIIGGYAITAFGAKFFSYVMTVAFILVVIGTVAAFWVLGTATHADFVQAINTFGVNLSYSGYLDLAAKNGWSLTPITWVWTLQSIPYSILLYNGFNYAAAASGEVRKPKSSMLIGIIGALAFGLVINMVGILFSVNVFGFDFLQSTVYLFNSGKWPYPTPPYINLFITPLIHDPLTLVLVQLGWIMWLVNWAGGIAIVCQRYIFAFSFDRILPVKLADVSTKYRIPTMAWLVNIFVAFLFAILAVFTPFLGVLLNSITIWSIVWFLASIVAIYVPFSKFKDSVKVLPGASWRVPLISIVAVFSAIAMALTFYYSVTTPAVGPSTFQSDLVLGAIFGSAIVIYAVSHVLNKRRGIDLGLIYSEIPPE